MLKILKDAYQIVTVNTNGENIKKGKGMNDLDILSGHSIIIEDDLIKDILPDYSIKTGLDYEVLSVRDKTILPGFVECHTHTAFAGSRANEFRLKLRGATYEEIAEAGGGINATVDAVRNSSVEQLVNLLIPRINHFISQGVTSLEIKSGYGLDCENELKMLKAINYCAGIFPIDIIPTFLGAHTFPMEFKNNHEGYLDIVINEMLPSIAAGKLAHFCDVFCESTAFSSEETDRIFLKATEAGLQIKIHSEQFNNIGGLETALKYNAVSIEHLEMLQDSQINSLASSETAAVLLPGVSYFLDYRFAPARKLIDSNALVALATDYNPGSSNISSLSLIMSLAAVKMKMTIEEIISSYTINSARALDINKKTGSIEIGKKADFSVFDTRDYSDLVYCTAENLNVITIKNGKIIFEKPVTI